MLAIIEVAQCGGVLCTLQSWSNTESNWVSPMQRHHLGCLDMLTVLEEMQLF